MSLTPSTLLLPDCLKNIKFPYDLARGAYFPNIIFLYPLPELLGNVTLMNFVNTLATNKTAVYHNEAAFGDDVNSCLDAFAMPKSTVVIPRYAPFIKTYNAETYCSGEDSDNLFVRWKANDFNLRTDLMTTNEWLQIPAVLELRRRDEEKKAKARRESESVAEVGQASPHVEIGSTLPCNDASPSIGRKRSNPTHSASGSLKASRSGVDDNVASSTKSRKFGSTNPDRCLTLQRQSPSGVYTDLRLYLILEYKWCSVSNEDQHLISGALAWLRRAGLYQLLWYCHCAETSERFVNPLGITLVNDRMVRVFRLQDGSFAVERRGEAIQNTSESMTVQQLDGLQAFWDDDHFGTSIADMDGMAKFVATVLTAMFFAASGSAPPWVARSAMPLDVVMGVCPAPKGDASALADLMAKRDESNDKYYARTKQLKPKSAQDSNPAQTGPSGGPDDDAGQPPEGPGGDHGDEGHRGNDSKGEGRGNNEDEEDGKENDRGSRQGGGAIDEDELFEDAFELSDDEDETIDYTKYRRLLTLSEVKLRLVSSDTMDRIIMDQDDNARLSVLVDDDTLTRASSPATLDLLLTPPQAQSESLGESENVAIHAEETRLELPPAMEHSTGLLPNANGLWSKDFRHTGVNSLDTNMTHGARD